MITAKIIADSITSTGNRITTMEVVLPRIVLAEFNTHRMFSRNSASSRAIPFNKMVKMVQDNPFIPIAWQKNHTGMQGTEYLDELGNQFAISTWLTGRDWAIKTAEALHSSQNGYDSITKQLCNRLLEPFMYHKIIVTATEWENFFKLRCPQYHSPVDIHFRHRSKKDCKAAHSNPINLELMEKMSEVEWLQINKSQAEIHIQAAAEAMWDALNESTPKILKAGEWHIPYGEDIDPSNLIRAIHDIDLSWENSSNIPQGIVYNYKIKIATARCARVSYTTVGDDGKIVPNDYAKDIQLHDRLAESGHWSPFEHCARAMSENEYFQNVSGEFLCMSRGNIKMVHTEASETHRGFGWSGNFKGFIQYRKLLENQ